MQETRIRSLSGQDPLEKEMAAHSSILNWRIPWTEEPGGLQSMGSQRVGQDLVTNTTNKISSLWVEPEPEWETVLTASFFIWWCQGSNEEKWLATLFLLPYLFPECIHIHFSLSPPSVPQASLPHPTPDLPTPILASVSQLCPTLCDPMNCSPPGSSVHGNSPGKNTKAVAVPFFKGYYQPRDQTQVSCIAVRFFTIYHQGSPCQDLG